MSAPTNGLFFLLEKFLSSRNYSSTSKPVGLGFPVSGDFVFNGQPPQDCLFLALECSFFLRKKNVLFSRLILFLILLDFRRGVFLFSLSDLLYHTTTLAIPPETITRSRLLNYFEEAKKHFATKALLRKKREVSKFKFLLRKAKALSLRLTRLQAAKPKYGYWPLRRYHKKVSVARRNLTLILFEIETERPDFFLKKLLIYTPGCKCIKLQ